MDCFERLFVTAAPRFEDVLPNIANPRSPWFDVMGDRLWVAHGASNRESDYAHWASMARLGMDKIVITDHETSWRDGGESFTLRTRTAPGKGGDGSQAWYAKALQDLGYVYGIYNTYTEVTPVNEFWDENYVARTPEGQLRPSWPRCYNLKPARAVEIEARLAPIIEEKFHLSTAYCDVHTAIPPWYYTDFDARVPGAGTFASTLYAYGEIMLSQKATWDGPVYSEGNAHWYYLGLTDGSYGQDQAARLPNNPWLVDFDLLKMHPHGVGFGMGGPTMFYPHNEGFGVGDQRVRRLDRFLAATIAFGHTGFFVQDLRIPGAARSYFMLQHLGKHYAAETAESIRYANSDGSLLTTSQAVATGDYKRSQIRTTYSNGLVTIVNGNTDETWACPVDNKVLRALSHDGDTMDLAPNGYLAYLMKSGDPVLLVLSNGIDGHRVDYADTPEHVFVDGRGEFTRFAKAATTGSFAAIYDGEGGAEVIPYSPGDGMAVSLAGQAAEAVALDNDRNIIGPVETRLCRSLVNITPVEGAVSYRLTPKTPPAIQLTCKRKTVVPGERVVVSGRDNHEVLIPDDAAPMTRHFVALEGAWIDFEIAPIVDADLTLPTLLERAAGDAQLHLALRSRVSEVTETDVRIGEASARVGLTPDEWVPIELPFEEPQDESIAELPLTVTTSHAEHRGSWWLKAEKGTLASATVPENSEVGTRVRGEKERAATGQERGYATLPRGA